MTNVVVDRKTLGRLVREWMDAAGFKKQQDLAGKSGVDSGTLSRLLNGVGNVGLKPELLELLAAACSPEVGDPVDPTPAFRLAGLVVGGPASPIPGGMLAMLEAWEPWELELLSDELEEIRARYRRIAKVVRGEVSPVIDTNVPKLAQSAIPHPGVTDGRRPKQYRGSRGRRSHRAGVSDATE